MLFLRKIRDWADRVFSKYRYDRANPWKSSTEAAKFYRTDEPIKFTSDNMGKDPLSCKANEIVVLHNAGNRHYDMDKKSYDTHGIDLLERVRKIPAKARQAVIDDFNRNLELIDTGLDEATVTRCTNMLNKSVISERAQIEKTFLNVSGE